MDKKNLRVFVEDGGAIREITLEEAEQHVAPWRIEIIESESEGLCLWCIKPASSDKPVDGTRWFAEATASAHHHGILGIIDVTKVGQIAFFLGQVRGHDRAKTRKDRRPYSEPIGNELTVQM